LSRRTLTDAQWARIEDDLPGREGLPGRSGVDNRLFVDAVLWLARTASPWRDLPPAFGKWTAVHARFRRWAMCTAPVSETPVCIYAAMGWLSIWSRLNWAGERWPCRSISQCSL
jgi:putative transposase